MRFVIPVLVLLFSVFIWRNFHKISNTRFDEDKIIQFFDSLKLKAQSAETYCLSRKLNTDYFFLIDMSRHSGLNRFYIWDKNADTIYKSFPVSHGCGNYPWNASFTKSNPKFSNENGSHCSSLGRYKIGERGYSQWGIHVKYLLHGLDKTNSNALKRQIVLHGWENVPDDEIYPFGTVEGWGCPALSNKNMTTVDSLLRLQHDPMLMWIY